MSLLQRGLPIMLLVGMSPGFAQQAVVRVAAPTSLEVPASQQHITPPPSIGGNSLQSSPAPAGGPSRAMPAPYPSSKGGADVPSPVLLNEALDKTAPLTAEQMEALKAELMKRFGVNYTNVNQPVAAPRTSVINLDISPGATPPVVRVAPNQGAIVSFLDAAGRPWPAVVADNYAPGGLVVSQFTEHQLSIALKGNAPVNGGVAVALKGLPTAVTLTVLSGQAETDRQVHVVLPRYLDGQPPGVGAIKGEPAIAAGDLMEFLLRTPPSSARKLEVVGLPDALAWQVGSNRMVLRTTAFVTTGYFRTQGLGDGTAVYELPLSPVVRVQQGDSIQAVHINGIQVETQE